MVMSGALKRMWAKRKKVENKGDWAREEPERKRWRVGEMRLYGRKASRVDVRRVWMRDGCHPGCSEVELFRHG